MFSKERIEEIRRGSSPTAEELVALLDRSERLRQLEAEIRFAEIESWI